MTFQDYSLKSPSSDIPTTSRDNYKSDVKSLLRKQSRVAGPHLGRVFVEALDSIDVAFWHKHRPVGQSYIVDCELAGTLDEQGFVMDFSSLKTHLKALLKKHIDHRLLLPLGDPCYELSQEDPSSIVWKATKYSDNDSAVHGLQTHLHTNNEEAFYYRGPAESVIACECMEVDAVFFSDWLQKFLQRKLSEDELFSRISDVRLRLRKEVTSEYTFHYTHGLPQHKGLCHRLFHGHRSKLRVYVDGKVRIDMAKYLVKDYLKGEPFHLAEPSQIVSSRFMEVGSFGCKGEVYTLSYSSMYGRFYATIPANHVLVIARATSIESLAFSLCQHLRQVDPRHSYRVEVYEGVNKGAIATL
ncbi:MAG: 6-carboxytetrahydropterin synthase [Proteobacteria bacterium]|nr:6-carboxytetrahydropterin synthase [Pseudomonadota bacterium]